MSLSRKLHDAEERGAKAVRDGAQRLKTAIQDISAGVRTVHLERKAANDKPAPTVSGAEQEPKTVADGKGRTGIVSVNGRDVGPMCCTGGQRTRGR